MSKSKPRVLILDIETAPILGYVWSLWQQNVGLNQVKQDWFVLSWAAMWRGETEVMYKDQRHARYLEDDRKLLKPLWKLLNEADIIVTQNGKAFDEKKLNARFIINGFKRPSTYRHIDTKLLAKKHFGFSSNSLEYLTDKLCIKHKKLKHKKFPGFELWRECLARNPEAWKEMEAYNRNDVLALAEVYERLAPWGTSVNFNVYNKHESFLCQCGHSAFIRDGYSYTNAGKFQKIRCKKCGAQYKEKENLLGLSKRKSMVGGI